MRAAIIIRRDNESSDFFENNIKSFVQRIASFDKNNDLFVAIHKIVNNSCVKQGEITTIVNTLIEEAEEKYPKLKYAEMETLNFYLVSDSVKDLVNHGYNFSSSELKWITQSILNIQEAMSVDETNCKVFVLDKKMKELITDFELLY